MFNSRETNKLHSARRTSENLSPFLADTIIGVTHELNNCIGVVLGNVQLLRLKDSQHSEAGGSEGYNRIEKSLFQGASLLRQIQKFAEKSSKPLTQLVEITDLVTETVEHDEGDWKTMASDKALNMTVNLPDSDVFVKGDARDLITAVSQLIKNAVEHSPPKGRVLINLKTAGMLCKIVVSDSGQGIPNEVRQKIYEPFFSTKENAGAGIGLTIVQSIVARHGGRISFNSNPENGTKFVISLPLEKSVDKNAPAQNNLENMISNVLVVDDDKEICRVLSDMLALEGLESRVCYNGYAALQTLEKEKYDLIITDWAMPGMSGQVLIEQVRENYPDVQIVLITGWGGTLTADQKNIPGVKAVVAKPFDLRDILKLVGCPEKT
jgi:CheY-like chemotaxis protein